MTTIQGANVRCENLQKAFGTVKAVNDVSFEIGGGEFVTLLGPSGSGKTTTLMMIAGFEVPTGGDILINDASVATIQPRSRNIGMIFPLMKIITPKTAGSKGYAEFQESMITQRNDVMAERALPYLQKGGVFMAVGALHLPGAEGLVEAFRQAGYTVSAIE